MARRRGGIAFPCPRVRKKSVRGKSSGSRRSGLPAVVTPRFPGIGVRCARHRHDRVTALTALRRHSNPVTPAHHCCGHIAWKPPPFVALRGVSTSFNITRRSDRSWRSHVASVGIFCPIDGPGIRRTVRVEGGSRCGADGSDAEGVLRETKIFRSCICRRYSAPSAGDVAAIIARTTMTRATNPQGGSMAARKKASKKAAKRGAKRGKKAAKRGKRM